MSGYEDLFCAARQRGHRVLMKSSHDGQEYPSQETADLMVTVMDKTGGIGHTPWVQAGTKLDLECSALLLALRSKKLVA